MSESFTASIFLPDESATSALGVELSKLLVAGDTLLLAGHVGAGKSHLARAVIKARLDHDEDVPSPTFTLVQTYMDATGTEIWHADLYRVGDIAEIDELGLEDALSTAICLVEWPEKLSNDTVGKDALNVVMSELDGGREVVLSSASLRWAKVSRALERTQFLIDADWQTATPSDIAGDLSNRTYQRLQSKAETAILMDAGDDIASTLDFVRMTHWLRSAGYSAPKIIAERANSGLLLLEDFGDEPLSARADINDQMSLCVELLADIRRQPCAELPCPSASELVEMTTISRHYPEVDELGLKAFSGTLLSAIQYVIKNVMPTVSLRDFHADNIMWLGERCGIQRLGLLDYQDAFLTHPVYDLVSLLTDARRDVSYQLRQDMIAYYAKVAGDDLDELSRAFAVFSAQRNLRILGIFARAATLSNKAHHVKNLPRVYGYLSEAVEHEIFADSGAKLMAALPTPDKALMARIAA